MSENEDDRLDRAKRIRKMREGDGREEDDADSASDDEPEQSTGEQRSSETTETQDSKESKSDHEGSEEMTDDTQHDDTGKEPDGNPGVPEVTVPDAPTETESTDTADTDTADDVSAPLPDTDQLEEALEASETTADTAAPGEVTQADTATPAGAMEEENTHEQETRVLEFELGSEYYCLDIDYIEEIVKEETMTRVPNTPEYVEGVVDLRGQITTILNPKVTIEKEDTTPGGLIIVFDSESFEDQGHIGWVVDDVRQVSPITDSEVNDPPVQESYINGVIDRDDDEQFVIWAEPSMAMEKAE